MTKNMGVWIDHRKAVIVTIDNDEVEIREITSNMEKHVRFSSGTHSKVNFESHGISSNTPNTSHGSTAEDVRDRQFGNHLEKFYEGVISSISDADSILIIGPGEAKVELESQLKRTEHRGQVVSVETADKMTDPQIAALVQEHFHQG